MANEGRIATLDVRQLNCDTNVKRNHAYSITVNHRR